MNEKQVHNIEEAIDRSELINIEIRKQKSVEIPEWVAIDIAREVCTDYVAQHNIDEETIDITQPSPKDDREGIFMTNGFHMFLALLKNVGVDTDTVRASLEQEGVKYSNAEIELHTSIAEERVASDEPISGLKDSYSTRERRYKYEVGEFYKGQRIETNFMRLMLIRNGNEADFKILFNDDYFNVVMNELGRFNAPDEIVDMAEGAVRRLLEGNLRQIAETGLDDSIKTAIAQLVAEQLPIYAEKVEQERRERVIHEAVANLETTGYIGKLLDFEHQEVLDEEDFIERPNVELDRKLIVEIVEAGKRHFLDRANNLIDPPIEPLNRLSNEDRRTKRLRGLRNQFIADFRSHIESSISMKAQATALFDMTDVYRYRDDENSTWINLVNKLIDLTTEEAQS